jgi:hypothetical protein
MKRFKSEKQLLARLKLDIEKSLKKAVVIQAGHFPLIFNPKSKKLEEGVKKWVAFTPLTFSWGCQLAAFARSIGKKPKIWIICDDHTYQPEYEAFRQKNALPLWNSERTRFFKSKSLRDSSLPATFEKIFKKYRLSSTISERHNQQKTGRKSCVYFSEKVLRKKRNNNPAAACTDEYVTLLDTYFDKKSEFLVSFVPLRCMHSIDDALLLFERDISSSHIFIQTGVSKKQVVNGKGIHYCHQHPTNL